eukprot:1160271-Pelagomonas_calceolata.AAC.4
MQDSTRWSPGCGDQLRSKHAHALEQQEELFNQWKAIFYSSQLSMKHKQQMVLIQGGRLEKTVERILVRANGEIKSILQSYRLRPISPGSSGSHSSRAFCLSADTDPGKCKNSEQSILEPQLKARARFLAQTGKFLMQVDGAVLVPWAHKAALEKMVWHAAVLWQEKIKQCSSEPMERRKRIKEG